MLLATASGAVDALALTALGHVFAGVMTGNLVLSGFAVAAGTLSGHPEGTSRSMLLLVVSGAMGAQSAAMLAGGSRTAPRTYFTGTLTSFFAQLSQRGWRVEWWAGVRLMAVAAGTAGAVGLRALATTWAFALPATLLVAALVLQGSSPWSTPHAVGPA
jgi:uncharacterized membrane protein YoaK (UPF0700 family)